MKSFLKLFFSIALVLTSFLIIGQAQAAQTLQPGDQPPTDLWAFNLTDKALGERVKTLDYGYKGSVPRTIIVGSQKTTGSTPMSTIYALDITDGHPLWSRSFGSVGTSGTSVSSVLSNFKNVMTVPDKNGDNLSDVYTILQITTSTGTTINRYLLDGGTGNTLWNDSGNFTDLFASNNNNNKPLTSFDIDGDGLTDMVNSPESGMVAATY